MIRWPYASRKTLTTALAASIVLLVIGLAGSIVFHSIAWFGVALVGVVIVAQLTLSKASHNTAVFLAERGAESAQAAATFPVASVTYAPGEPLDLLRRDLQRDVSALLTLNTLLDVPGRLPAPGGWAATPDTILALVSAVLSAKGPSTIVECGSGTSTAWMSLALSSVGAGRLISLEHEESYGGQTRQALADVGLASLADVRVHPLESRRIDDETHVWFPSAAFADIEAITLLFVDGPPGYIGPEARFPAVPLLASQLADGALVVLDDIDRPEEQAILARWLGRSWSGVTLTEESRTDRAVLLRASR
jgi:predicted O-methyltransferase YrrM